MNEDEELMAAFLADPEGPAAGAYAAWLDEQHNKTDTQRAEYLRLVCGLQQRPANTRPDPLTRRLYILRGRVPAEWADRVDATRIALGGVYQSEEMDGAWHYLRFYPDKSVLSVCSAQTPGEVWRRFDEIKGLAKDDHALGRGVYSISYSGFSFSLVQEPPDWMQSALQDWCAQRLEEEIARGDFDFIGPDVAVRQRSRELKESVRTLHYSGDPGRHTMRLEWSRPLDESRGTLTYQFLEIKP